MFFTLVEENIFFSDLNNMKSIFQIDRLIELVDNNRTAFLSILCSQKVEKIEEKKTHLYFEKTNFIASLQIYSQVISGLLRKHGNQVTKYL